MSRLKTFIEPTKKMPLFALIQKMFVLLQLLQYYYGGDDTRQNTLTGFLFPGLKVYKKIEFRPLGDA